MKLNSRLHLRACVQAFQLMTQVPMPNTHYSPESQGLSLLYYPLVGLFLGAVLCGFVILLPAQHPSLSAALLLSLWVLLTGALHLDGLADLTDAMAGGHRDSSRMLSIMKEPQAGPMAVVVLGLVLLIKWSALSVVIQEQALWLLFVTPMLARVGLFPVILYLPYARQTGMCEWIAKYFPRRIALTVFIATWLLVIWIYPTFSVFIAFCFIGFAFVFFYRYLKRTLGGYTGDCLGAWVEVQEVFYLLMVMYWVP